MTNSLIEFGEALKARRTSQKKSLRRVELDLSAFLGSEAKGCDHTTIAKDEKGKSLEIPFNRIKGYAHVYRITVEQLLAEYLLASHGIDYTRMIEVKATRIEEVIPPEEREAYRMFRQLLDKKSQEGVLACLKMMIGEDAGNKPKSPVKTEEESEGAA